MADGQTPQERLMAFAQKVMARPIVPTDGALPTLHVGDNELPWAEAGDGSAIQLLHVDLNGGLWISKTRLPPGYRVPTHYHTGLVYAVTLKGSWWYEESPEAVNSPGSYLFEPAASRHTLVTPKDQVGDTITWFAIYGANVNLDDKGQITSIMDARTALYLYRGYCEALGLDSSKLIVHGE
jgi:2,4'-dihydroxyacetophenone dioxygenase